MNFCREEFWSEGFSSSLQTSTTLRYANDFVASHSALGEPTNQLDDFSQCFLLTGQSDLNQID